MKQWLMLAACCLLGCSSAPVLPTKAYLIPHQAVKPMAKQSAPLLLVKTQLTGHLNGDGLIYRVSEAEVIEASQNQWAYAIDEQLNRLIIDELRAKQSNYWPVEFNSALKLKGHQQLQIKLDKFNGVYNGIAEVGGEWLLVSEKGELLRNDYFLFEMPLEASGYQALVTALGDGSQALTALIAGQLQQQPAKP